MAPTKNDDKGDSCLHGAGVTLLVCVTCGQKTPESDINGPKLLSALQAENFQKDVRIQPIKCFGACHHSCAVGVTATGKVGFLFGNLSVKNAVAALRDYVPKYLASKNGVVPRADRPDILKDILIRLPNPEWVSDDGVIRAADDEGPRPGHFRQAFDDV